MAKIKGWQSKFVLDIKNKFKVANLEYEQYKQTGCIIYLQQAGNKLFSVVENYLMVKNDYRVRSYQQVLKLVENNNYDLELLTQAVQLHYFFYNGDLYMDKNTAEKIFKIVMKKMRGRI